MLSIRIPDLSIEYYLQLDDWTLVSEILESIQDKLQSEVEQSKQDQFNVNKNIKLWTCYSITQQKVLSQRDKLRTKQNEELYIYFYNKDNFSEIYVSKDQDYNQITQISQLSTDRQTTNQSYLQFQTKKIIYLDGIKQIIEMDGKTEVKELLEFLAKENNIDLEKITHWFCFSEEKKRKMNLDEQIGCQSNEIFQINTHRVTHRVQHNQFSKSVGEQENFINYQYYHENPEVLMCSKTITLIIAVHDNINVRKLTAMYLLNSTIENIANDVLRFSSLTIQQVSIDIFINEKQFNNPDKRALTIQDANLNRESKIVARIRWIN